MKATLPIILIALGVGLARVAPAHPGEGGVPRSFDPSPYTQRVTDCDRRAAHPDDPNRLVPGVEHEAIDLPAAVAACRAALAADPRNPRIQYQLARVLRSGA